MTPEFERALIVFERHVREDFARVVLSGELSAYVRDAIDSLERQEAARRFGERAARVFEDLAEQLRTRSELERLRRSIRDVTVSGLEQLKSSAEAKHARAVAAHRRVCLQARRARPERCREPRRHAGQPKGRVCASGDRWRVMFW